MQELHYFILWKFVQKLYDLYNTDEERLCHKPPHLSNDEWRWLINFWDTPKAKVNIMIFFHTVYLFILILK